MSKFLKQKPIILASGSLIRQKLMQSLGLEFLTIPSHCDENAIKAANGSNDVIGLGFELAKAKALEVSIRYPDHYVIAADQLCVTDQGILDKPLNYETASQHLRQLSNATHQQIACLCIAKGNTILWTHHEKAYLTMGKLSSQTIETYLQAEQPYQSCGAYQYESMGKWLFTEVNGSEDTILGLPLRPLIHSLSELQICRISSS